MKRILSHSMLLTPLAILVLASSPAQSISPIDAMASAPKETVAEKTIYIDLSLNEEFLDPAGERFLTYENDIEDVEYPLSSVGEEIYSISLPIDLLNNDDFNFSIKCYIPSEGGEPADPIVLSSVSVKANEKLSNVNCNYVAIGIGKETEFAPIEGYGYYAERTPDPGSTYATQRVWLSNADVKNSTKAFGEGNAVGYYEKEEWHIVDMTPVGNGENDILYYADIPAEAVSVDFLRIATAENHNYCIYSEMAVEPISYGNCYALSDGGLTLIEVIGADANLLALVVEAYLTYGDSPSNGTVASTVSSLYNTWFKNKSANLASLQKTKILDYTGYTANGNSYEGLTKKTSFSVSEKWSALCSHAGIDSNTGKERTINISVGGISKKTLLLAAAGIAGFAALMIVFAFFLRRHNNAR